MRREWLKLTAAALLSLAGAGCKSDSNNVAGPMPTMTAARTVPPGATPTPNPSPGGSRVVNVGQAGNAFVDQQSGTSTTTIAAGGTVQWSWVSGTHSTTSGSCSGACTPDGLWNSGAGSGMVFSRTFNQVGTFRYFCLVHGAMMTGTVIVQQ